MNGENGKGILSTIRWIVEEYLSIFSPKSTFTKLANTYTKRWEYTRPKRAGRSTNDLVILSGKVPRI
ncbi:MAG TPA: hypothetical protein PK108_15745 [Pyrinomonadaceae bacterium]|nr:hypothetical protein [Acidobacteriota bacterium]HQZ96256.1 hypothetical protein [Pyrinomonadaceae bacterium]HRA41994.1 hypothetical protein [Pyrinomonadaceae bacterium]